MVWFLGSNFLEFSPRILGFEFSWVFPCSRRVVEINEKQWKCLWHFRHLFLQNLSRNVWFYLFICLERLYCWPLLLVWRSSLLLGMKTLFWELKTEHNFERKFLVKISDELQLHLKPLLGFPIQKSMFSWRKLAWHGLIVQFWLENKQLFWECFFNKV